MSVKRQKRAELEFLDIAGIEIIVVRGRQCELLHMNEAASGRSMDCSASNPYLVFFPELLQRCSEADASMGAQFELTDIKNRPHTIHMKKIRWVDGKSALILFFHNIDELHKQKQQLYNLAYIDQLTGIPNRQRFRMDFDDVSAQIENHSLFGVIALFDLDNFKTINDNYGHHVGDIMLRRLADHMQSDPCFSGHIYRLGGDEFVLFFADSDPALNELSVAQERYTALLQDALQTYSLPNIDAVCTLSMGVSFFPHQGRQYSDLLRKADIALYNAKSSGRNQYAFFQNQYETSKKLRDMFVNIVPILRNDGNTFGYALHDACTAIENEGTVQLTDINRTLDVLGLGELNSDARYFIPYTDRLAMLAIQNALPPGKFVLQINHDSIAQRSIPFLHKLKQSEMQIAVYIEGKKPIDSFIISLSNYIILSSHMERSAQQRLLRENKKIFIATDVDSQADLDRCVSMGYLLFQGLYFIHQPATLHRIKDIEPLKVNYYRLLKMTASSTPVNFSEISELISSDVALSYKLLRMLNSAALGLRNRISSISMAVTYMGEANLRKWVSLLAIRGLSADKPLELVRLSLIRAKFGELLSVNMKPPVDAEQVFMLGLLSLLHIAMDVTREELLGDIAFSDNLRASLLCNDGPYSDIVVFYEQYEYANWDEIIQFATQRQIDCQFINDSYIQAVKWGSSLIGETS